MGQWLLAGAVAALSLAPACTHHTIKLEPIEIKPIHITMDVNIRVQKQIESDFAFMDEAQPKGEKKEAPK